MIKINDSKMRTDILSPEWFLQTVQSLTTSQAAAKQPALKRLCIGFSGGVDSQVLLSLCAKAFCKNVVDSTGYVVEAVHIHHGLSPNADNWVLHCKKICTQLDIPLTVLHVDATVSDGSSPEEVAREARYEAFQNFLQEGDCLLLAHHACDQAETILLRLFRGTGPLGLGGMPEKGTLGKGQFIRPFLTIPKEAILEYAEKAALQWIEDESNLNTRFDRNFLRQEILPKLKARWPRVLRSVSRAGALCLEMAAQVHNQAAKDFETVKIRHVTKDFATVKSKQAAKEFATVDLETLDIESADFETDMIPDEPNFELSVSKLLNLEPQQRMAVIRYWLQAANLPLPSRDHMERIDREVLRAKPGSRPRLKITNYEIRRERDILKVVAVATTSHYP